MPERVHMGIVVFVSGNIVFVCSKQVVCVCNDFFSVFCCARGNSVRRFCVEYIEITCFLCVFVLE